MTNEVIEKLGELIENCGHSSRLLIKAESCLKNGDLQNTQKYTKEASQFVSVMKNDVFLEIAEAFEMQTEECAEIEDIDTLEMCKHICDITYHAGVLLGLTQENFDSGICNQVKKTILQHINAVNKLYAAIFAN